MAATTSLPTVSAKIVGDASGLVSELKRAETATNVSTAKIDAQIEHMAKNISRKYSLAHMGTDVLRGLGIGSGFALAEKAAELISRKWKEAAEAAQDVEKSSERQLKLVQELIASNQTPKQRLATLTGEESRLKRERESLLKPVFETYYVGDQMGGQGSRHTRVTEPTAEVKKALAKNAEDIQRVGNEIKSTEKTIAEAREKGIQANYDYIDSLAKVADELTQSVETPMERYKRKIGEIADAMNPNVSTETYNRLMDRAKKEYEKAVRLENGDRDRPLSDSMTRLGLVGGVGKTGGTSPLEKQVNLLTQIRDALRGKTAPQLMEHNNQLYYQ